MKDRFWERIEDRQTCVRVREQEGWWQTRRWIRFHCIVAKDSEVGAGGGHLQFLGLLVVDHAALDKGGGAVTPRIAQR